jgi:hypothetical protein
MTRGFSPHSICTALFTVLFLNVRSAQADLIDCEFPKEGLRVTLKLTTDLLVIERQSDGTKSVLRQIQVRISGPGDLLVFARRSEPILSLRLDHRTSDPSGSWTYPFTAEFDPPGPTKLLVGGCESELLKRQPSLTTIDSTR